MKLWKKAAVVLFLLLCGSLFFLFWKQGQPIELRVGVFSGSNWDVPAANSYRILDEVIARFEEEHPHVTITYQSGIRKEQYEEWLAQKTMKEEMPDLLFVPSEQFSTLAENGSLENLHSYIEQEDEAFLSSFYETALQEGMLDDVYYALPYESVPTLMFVNKTLLEAEGIEMPSKDWSWEDFYEICKAVTKDTNGDGQINQFGVYGYTWQQATYSNGAEVYDEIHNSVQLDQPQVIEAVSFLRRLQALHDERVNAEAFDKGQVAFCPMDYSTYRTYMPYPWRVKKFSSFAWDSIPLPKGPQGTNASTIDTFMVAMSSRSSHKQLVWELMKQLSSDEATQTEVAISSQGVSVLSKVMQNPQVMEELNCNTPGNSQLELSILDTVMRQGIAVRSTQSYEQSMQSVDAEIMTLLQNDQDIENRLILLEHQINAMLSK